MSMNLTLTSDKTRLASLLVGERELLYCEQKPIFTLRARDESGNARLFSADEAEISICGEVIVYAFDELTVKLTISCAESIGFKFAIENESRLVPEFIDLPNVSFGGRLRENGGDSAIVSSYNEGMLVENSIWKKNMRDPEFPSLGGYMMYPYMLGAPIMMWLFGKEGILMSVLDEGLGPKGLDFACREDHTEFRTRIFLGGTSGEGLEVVWEHFDGDWQNGAQLYRDRISDRLAEIAKAALPEWYTDEMPLVITYPVRGMHDMDIMNPNKLFPYHNVLPIVEELAEKTNSRIMVLLMHWEGTAPWAPPYVWPPYGGAELFGDFMKKLHESGNLLGVYCSGLGFTEQSNLIAEYNCADKIEAEGLKRGFCAAPDGSITHSRICTGQRSGYDICAANELGKKTLDDALEPLLTSGVDYIQALDQNHGGGMYFCYSKEHGHPSVPGSWMTKASLELLEGWKRKCPNTLLGCESAAAEPYISELRLSDNRYELCYMYGVPIPLYAYLYHSCLHNFMGNQVSCPLEHSTEAILLRIAYSFTAGDMITLILNDEGNICFQWGGKHGSCDDREGVIKFVTQLRAWHKKYPELFKNAEMTLPIGYECDIRDIALRESGVRHIPAVLSSFWKADGKTLGLFVNYTDEARVVKLERSGLIGTLDGATENNSEFTIAARSAVSVEF